MAQTHADHVESIPAPKCCPDCGTVLLQKGFRQRDVVDSQPVRVLRWVYQLERKHCPRCRKHVQAQAPGVLPKSLYGNQLLTHVAVEHYLHGITLGYLERQTGVGYSSLVDAMHNLARRLEPCMDKLKSEYRSALVKHADETGWRTDGQNGYAWLFTTPTLSFFRFRKTRSATVVQDVLGTKRLPGVLVVDRYNAYNKAPCRLQYCYAHLLRGVEDLQKEFPDNPEIQVFVETFSPLLKQAMHLRTLKLSVAMFRRQACQIKQNIIKAVTASASHPGIQAIQNIFREKAKRLYAWATDSQIPAENNFAERELRPLVIARKVSFGSQSDAGAHTREILMSVLLTLKKRKSNVSLALKSALDALAEKPASSPYDLLFSLNSS